MTFAIKRQTSPPPFNGAVFHFPFSKHTEKGLKTPVFVAEESLMALKTPSPLNSKCHEKFPLFLSPSLNLPNMIIYQIWNIPNCSNTHPPNPKPHHTMFKIQIHTSNIHPSQIYSKQIYTISKIQPSTNQFMIQIHQIQNLTKRQSVQRLCQWVTLRQWDAWALSFKITLFWGPIGKPW